MRSFVSRLLLALNSAFITVAVILGTGILGLPIKMSKSGFSPFLLTFVLCLAMQLSVGIVFVELLQRADVKLQLLALPSSQEHKDKPATLDSVEQSLLSDTSSAEDSSSDVSKEQTKLSEQTEGKGHHHEPGKVDLHSIGALYLESDFARLAFDTVVIMHFVSVLVSYGLAGPEAIGNLVGVHYSYLILPFIVILAMTVLVFGDAVQPFVSGLTVFKCIILVVVIGAMGFVAATVQQTPSESWSEVLEPFLIGTVALGGFINLMPVLYGNLASDERGETEDNRSGLTDAKPRIITKDPQDLSDLRNSVCAAVILCWILNACWSYFVLHIVPQTGGDNSLEAAARNGTISTVAVSAVLEQSFPSFLWIAHALDIFITVSVLVSFLAMSIGFKHVLDGIAVDVERVSVARSAALIRAAATLRNACSVAVGTCIREAPAAAFERWVLYTVGFGFVLVVALVNPKGFLVFLETFTSLALNLESGVFVAMMYNAAASPAEDQAFAAAGIISLSLPLSAGTGSILSRFCSWSFWIACIYDIVKAAVSVCGISAALSSLIVLITGLWWSLVLADVEEDRIAVSREIGRMLYCPELGDLILKCAESCAPLGARGGGSAYALQEDDRVEDGGIEGQELLDGINSSSSSSPSRPLLTRTVARTWTMRLTLLSALSSGTGTLAPALIAAFAVLGFVWETIIASFPVLTSTAAAAAGGAQEGRDTGTSYKVLADVFALPILAFGMAGVAVATIVIQFSTAHVFSGLALTAATIAAGVLAGDRYGFLG